MSLPPLGFFPRFFFAWACFWRALFDGGYAAQLQAATSAAPATPEKEPAKKEAPPRDDGSALLLLSLLQREGRLVDFLKQDIASFGDADVGAAARVVHEGARKALLSHVKIEPVRSENEGAKVTIEAGYPAASVKLTGNVQGAPPYRGTLRHKGWRITSIELPTPLGDHDATVLAPAEVEL